MKKTFKMVFAGMAVCILLFPLIVFAQVQDLPGTAFDLDKIKQMVIDLANFMVYIGTAVIIIFLIWGGITYMMAGGDETKIATAKRRIIQGIVGAAIIIGAGTIISTLKRIFESGSL